MLGQILGSGAGLLFIGLAAIIMRHLERAGGGMGGGGRPGMPGGGGAPGRGQMRQIKASAHLWSRRAMIILGFLGAVLMTATGLGNFIHGVTTSLLGHVGFALVIDTLLFAAALGGAIVGIVKDPGKGAMITAELMAFTLTLPMMGVFGQIAARLLADGNMYAAQLTAALGVS